MVSYYVFMNDIYDKFICREVCEQYSFRIFLHLALMAKFT